MNILNIGTYKILALSLLFCLPIQLSGQTDYRVQSMFIYNFTSMVNWPSNYHSGDFILAVFGVSPMYEEFQDMAEKRTVGSRPIVTKQFNSIREISKCHIIYIPARYSRHIPDIVNYLRAKNISALVVTDSGGSVKRGAVINFTVQHGRQRFQISRENARSLGLTLGGELVRLGISMD